MIETIISFTDLFAFLIFLLSIIALIIKAKKSVFHTPYALLISFLIGYTFISFSNFLQHSLIGIILNPYEDYIAILSLIFLGFFFYTYYIKCQLKEIEKSNKLFKTLVEDIPGIVYMVKLEKNYPTLFVSPQVEQYFGYKPEEFYKDPLLWDNKIIEEDREKAIKIYEETIKSQKTTSIEYRIRLKDNKIHWFKDEQKYFLIDNIPHIIGVSIDITDTKEYYNKLNETNLILERKLKAIETINRLAEKLITVSSPEDIMKESVKIMKGFLGEPKIAIFKLNEKEHLLNLVYSCGFKTSTLKVGSKLPLNNSLSGITCKKKKVIVSYDLGKDERLEPNTKKELLKEGLNSLISIPLISKNRCVGVMNLIYLDKIEVDEIDIKTVESIGKTIGLALENTYNIEKLFESEEKYRTLAETAKDIIIIHDLEGNILYANKAAFELSGYKKEDISKVKIKDIFPSDEKDKFYQRIRKRLSGDKSTFTYTAKFPDKHGEMKYLDVVSTPIIKDGKIESILSISRDITIRLNQEKRIKTLSYVIEQTTSSVIITDIEGNIKYVNPTFEKITGYKFEEVKGENPRILKSGEHSKEFYKNIWDTITSGKVWHGILVNKKKDGSIFYEDTSIFPIKDENGETLHYAAVKKDITKEKKYENQVRQMQRLDAIGNLTTGIAHDFNNILTSILGYSDILENSLKEDKKSLERIKIIKSAGEKAKNLVSKLLAYSRKQLIKPEPLNINQAVKGLENVLKRLISENIELVFKLKDGIKNIYADNSQIEQILMNLVVNSKDAVLESKKKDKEIIIETNQIKIEEHYVKEHAGSSQGDFILLSVSDNGIGMSEKIKNKVFEPFFTTKGKNRGTGLGLSTVYGIVKQNKGFIYVYSEENIGTTIKIYLPVYEGKDNSNAENKNNDKPAPLKKIEIKENCLIVEDDRDVRKIISEYLSFFGFNVYEASNGAEGLKIMKKIKDLKLILSDVVMPKMDGFEFYNKAIKINKNIKFIFSSGYPLTHPEISKKINGNVAFLQKPFTLDDLSLKLEKLFY